MLSPQLTRPQILIEANKPSSTLAAASHRFCARQAFRSMATSTASSNESSGETNLDKFKFAAIQMKCTSDKLANLEHAYQLIKEAATNGAHLISLPVCNHMINYLGNRNGDSML